MGMRSRPQEAAALRRVSAQRVVTSIMATRRKIPHGERMHPAQEFLVEYGGFSFAYRLLVGFPRFLPRLGDSLEDPTVDLRLKAKECGMDGDGQAEEGLDSRRLVVTERPFCFHDGQPAGQGYADVHGDKRYRVRSGVLAGLVYERCDRDRSVFVLLVS